MKKRFLIICLFFLSPFLWSQNVELKAVKQFKNDESSIHIRKEVNAQDDITGNDIFFNEFGNLMIYQRDKTKIFFIDENFQIKRIIDIKTNTHLHTFQTVGSNILIGNYTDAFYINNNGEELFRVKIYSILNEYNGTDGNWFNACYYDEKSDIIFFTAKHNKLHCILNPTLDEKQNKSNFYTSGETQKLLEDGLYAPHLTLNEYNYLFIDGIRYRWGATAYETKKYICTLNQEMKYIRLFDRKDSNLIYYTIPENEEVESITYHPNGDWYFLTINWSTNVHALWRIENTWDSQWREQWDGEHVVGKVAVNKKMVCNDNLRLRSEEATSSNIITTMSKGTKVKILKLGKAEKIDGINSNWVQIEILSDAKDKDGKSIKTGTIGWCYGGYLE